MRSGVLENDRVRTYMGDDYLSIDSRSLVWTSDDWPSLYTVDDGPPEVVTPATVTVIVDEVGEFEAAVDEVSTVSLSLTCEQSASIPAGTHDFRIIAVIDGRTVTLVDTTWVSVAALTVPDEA